MNVDTLFRAQAVKNIFGGDAICRVAGQVVFTSGVIAGEEFIGRIKRICKDYARAEVVEILKPSPDRIKPDCSGMGRCPGCVYGHMTHQAEQNQKLEQLRDFLKPLGVQPEDVKGYELESAPEKFYRNKIRLTMRKAGGEAQLGYVFPDGKMYVLNNCLLASNAINTKLSVLLADPGFIPSMHDRMTITLRESADGVICFRNSAGKRMGLLRENVLNKDFMVPAEGFFQVNQAGLNALISLLQNVLRELNCSTLVDAYAGSGLFGSAAAAAGVAKIIGVESDPASAETARMNYRNFGSEDFIFHTGDTEEILPEILKNISSDALVVIDPPRGGMDGKAVRILNASDIKNVVYISCHPATLVRDLQRLQRRDFKIKSAFMIDMFPRSSHFETFIQLAR